MFLFILIYFIQNQIGDTTMKIIDHEIKRYVVRVKEFKEKSENLKNIVGQEGYEVKVEELRKDEKKLAVSIFKSLIILYYRTSLKSKRKCCL